jgi:hypothetical protein
LICCAAWFRIQGVKWSWLIGNRQEQDMTVGQTIRHSGPWVTLLGASAGAALIVAVAPEVGAGMLAALIAGWAALGIVRVLVLVGLARELFHRLEAALAPATN